MGGGVLFALGERGVHVWNDTAGSDGGAAQVLVELFVILDGELDVTWDNALLFVVLGAIASKLEELSCQVLKDGCNVNWSTTTDALGEATLLQVTSDTTDWEGEASFCRSGAWTRCRFLGSSFLSFAGHREFETIRSLLHTELTKLTTNLDTNDYTQKFVQC